MSGGRMSEGNAPPNGELRPGDTRLHTFLRLAVLRLAPTPGPRFGALLGAMAVTYDACSEVVRLAARWRLDAAPDGLPPVDALPYMLRAAGLPMYESLTEAATPGGYARILARLARKWLAHGRAGTPDAIREELEAEGFPGATIVEWPSVEPTLEGSSFSLTLPQFEEPVDWGEADWGAFTWDVSGVTRGEAERIQAIVQFWRSARSFCVSWVP